MNKNLQTILTSALVALIVTVAAGFIPGSPVHRFGAEGDTNVTNLVASGYVDGTTFKLNGSAFIDSSGFMTTGWDKLGSTKLTGSATTTATVTIPARDVLQICVSVPSYGGSDIASLRFNADSANDYTSRYLSFANGTTTPVDNATSAVPLARLFAVAQVAGRTGCYFITNSTTKDKMGAASGFSGNGTSTTSSIVEFGGFEWATTTQITSVTMVTAAGQTLATGSGFVVFGKNF